MSMNQPVPLRSGSARSVSQLSSKNPAVFDAKPHDEHAAHELHQYIHNDADLHRQQHHPIIKNLMHKKARGIYDSGKAHKLFGYLADNGAQKYHKEHGAAHQPWHHAFTPATRHEVARRLRNDFEGEAKTGSYDHLVPKKYAGQAIKHSDEVGAVKFSADGFDAAGLHSALLTHGYYRTPSKDHSDVVKYANRNGHSKAWISHGGRYLGSRHMGVTSTISTVEGAHRHFTEIHGDPSKWKPGAKHSDEVAGAKFGQLERHNSLIKSGWERYKGGLSTHSYTKSVKDPSRASGFAEHYLHLHGDGSAEHTSTAGHHKAHRTHQGAIDAARKMIGDSAKHSDGADVATFGEKGPSSGDFHSLTPRMHMQEHDHHHIRMVDHKAQEAKTKGNESLKHRDAYAHHAYMKEAHHHGAIAAVHASAVADHEARGSSREIIKSHKDLEASHREIADKHVSAAKNFKTPNPPRVTHTPVKLRAAFSIGGGK